MGKIVKFRVDGVKGGSVHICDEKTWRAQAKKAVQHGDTVIFGSVGYALEEHEDYKTGRVFKVRAAFNYYGTNGQSRIAIERFPWELPEITGERVMESDGGLWIQRVGL